MTQIEKKAKENVISVEKQVMLDAKWQVNQLRQKGEINNRWKRNPRMSNYSFLLVIVDEGELKKIPAHYQDVTVADANGYYHNPYAYYLNPTEESPKFDTYLFQDQLKVAMKYDPSSGIFVNTADFNKDVNTQFDDYCSSNEYLFLNAQFEQYFHSLNKKTTFKNIPLRQDVISDNYTQVQYVENANKFTEGERVVDSSTLPEHLVKR